MATAKILVADDNDAICGMFAELLREADFGVTTVASGEAAAAILETEQFQVAVVDVRMPGGGAAGFISLRERFPETKWIVCSGLLSDIEAERFQRLGADAVLEKTSAPLSLVSTVQRVLAELG